MSGLSHGPETGSNNFSHLAAQTVSASIFRSPFEHNVAFCIDISSDVNRRDLSWPSFFFVLVADKLNRASEVHFILCVEALISPTVVNGIPILAVKTDILDVCAKRLDNSLIFPEQFLWKAAHSLR